MLDRKDHLELLALIEGELDAATVDSLRGRLSGEPRVLAVIDQMRQDRMALRSTAEPELPRDFLADLEPLIARPMLIEPVALADSDRVLRPGESRRQYHRRHRRIRWARIAAAAIVLIALGTGTFTAINRLLPERQEQTGGSAIARSGDSSEATAANRPVTPPTDGLVHHHALALIETPARTGEGRTGPAARIAQTAPVTADFAIMLVGSTDSEASLVQVAASASVSATVVRNFSYAEAQRIAEEWRVAQTSIPRGADRPPLVSSMGTGTAPSDIRALAERVRQRVDRAALLRERSTSPHASEPASGRLIGPEQHAPSLEQQLELSSRGATHAISVRVADLQLMVERLALTNPGATLRMIPQSADGADENGRTTMLNPLASWLQEGPHVRQSFERISHLPPDTIVVLPVVIP